MPRKLGGGLTVSVAEGETQTEEGELRAPLESDKSEAQHPGPEIKTTVPPSWKRAMASLDKGKNKNALPPHAARSLVLAIYDARLLTDRAESHVRYGTGAHYTSQLDMADYTIAGCGRRTSNQAADNHHIYIHQYAVPRTPLWNGAKDSR